ncbi:7552_t:CDS:2, partial [Gigaspora margarita]
KKDFLILKKLIKELSTKPETQNKIINQEVITSYYLFGKAIEDKSQLPNSVSDDLFRKKKERAQKIYELFTEIGVDKIQ